LITTCRLQSKNAFESLIQIIEAYFVDPAGDPLTI